MQKLWEVVSGAPWWVYVLFVYLVNIGIKSIKPRTVPVRRVVLMPLVFVAWSLYALYERLTPESLSLCPLWGAFLAVGAYLGYREVRGWKISTDRRKGEMTIPGNYSTLVLILLIFVMKFFFGYLYSTRETIPYGIYFWDTLTSSLVTGFFVGRATLFLWRYQK